MCNKQRFSSRQQAEQAAREYMVENKQYKTCFRAYRCECGYWHLTSKRPDIKLEHSDARKLACDGLVRYEKESDAKKATGATRSTMKSLFYYCDICHQYHPK